MQELEKMAAGLSMIRLLSGRKPRLPAPLSIVHTARDDSSQLSEESLQLMLAVLVEISM